MTGGSLAELRRSPPHTRARAAAVSWPSERGVRAPTGERTEVTNMSRWVPDPKALQGRIAVVAGATRGAGRGIAAALGEAGATVICTGRSSRERPLPSDYDRPETIEETAELVTALGGRGIPIVVDHLDPAQVEGLAKHIRAT